MIRFVNTRNQNIGYGFAFWNTRTNTFEGHSGVMAWDSWGEFAGDYEGKDLDRYRRICPDWIFPYTGIRRCCRR